MRSHRPWAMAVATTLLVAACAPDGPDTTPFPTSVSAALSPVPASCSFPTMKNAAKAWFRVSNDVVYTQIQTMQSAYKSGAAAATGPGFDVLARVQQAVGNATLVKGTPAQGDAFVKSVIACMSVGTLPTVGVDFEGALGSNGLFAVVAGTSAPVTSRGTPKYVAEPTGGKTWFQSAGNKRFLLYGYPIDYNTFTSESAVLPKAYELSTIPAALTFSPAIVAGECESTDALEPDRALQHRQQILAMNVPTFCETYTPATASGNSFLGMARLAVGLFLPTPLHAIQTRSTRGSGGLLGSLSPLGPVTFDGTSVSLTFTVPPTNAKVSEVTNQFSPAVAVKAQTANGTPVGGVVVTLSIVGNNGSWKVVNNVATTGPDGVATFTGLYINKPGGYTVTAFGSIFDGSTQSSAPVFFNVSGL